MSKELIERMKKHFDSQGIKEIEVPEWGEEDQPLIIYCKPFSVEEKSHIRKNSAGYNEIETLATIVKMKALDKDMNHLFTKEDKSALLKHADPDVISRIVDAMYIRNDKAVSGGE